MIVSETSSDASTVKITATGNDRMYWPAPPGRKSKGTKARISVAVAPTTATAICFVASMAACIRVWPVRRKRVMFSTTTIESSTMSPSAITAPTIESWLIVKPVKRSRAIPINSESGIDIMTIPAARIPAGAA